MKNVKIRRTGIIIATLAIGFSLSTMEPIYADNQTKLIEDSFKIDESKEQYLISSNNEFIIIKQGNGNIAVWTNQNLSNEEQIQFRQEWFKLNNCDPSIKETDNFYYIDGYGEHDLSYLGKQWGKYEFLENNDTILLNCDSSKISHLNYGNFKKKNVLTPPTDTPSDIPNLPPYNPPIIINENNQPNPETGLNNDLFISYIGLGTSCISATSLILVRKRKD